MEWILAYVFITWPSTLSDEKQAAESISGNNHQPKLPVRAPDSVRRVGSLSVRLTVEVGSLSTLTHWDTELLSRGTLYRDS